MAPGVSALQPFFPRRRSHRRESSAREQVLAQWRGINLAPLEKGAVRSAQPVQNILPRVLGGMRMDRRRSEAEIVKVWNNAMDPNIAAHAQPTGIRQGTLFVTVDSNVWLSEIVRYRRKEILDRLQHSFGREMVKRVSYRVG
jgi:predicted nucleic acid-binding Zn ribbon protein